MSNVKKQKESLVKWCATQVRDYDVVVNNLTSDWKSGLALCAILHYYDPDSIDYSMLLNSGPEERITRALDVADRHWGIPKLIDLEDLLVDRVDSKQMYTYLAEYYKRLQAEIPKRTSTQKPVKKLKKKKQPDMSEAGLKKAMDRAMNKMKRRGKLTELLAAKREGRMEEFLLPELERAGYDRASLRELGVNIGSGVNTSEHHKSFGSSGSSEDTEMRKRVPGRSEGTGIRKRVPGRSEDVDKQKNVPGSSEDTETRKRLPGESENTEVRKRLPGSLEEAEMRKRLSEFTDACDTFLEKFRKADPNHIQKLHEDFPTNAPLFDLIQQSKSMKSQQIQEYFTLPNGEYDLERVQQISNALSVNTRVPVRPNNIYYGKEVGDKLEELVNAFESHFPLDDNDIGGMNLDAAKLDKFMENLNENSGAADYEYVTIGTRSAFEITQGSSFKSKLQALAEEYAVGAEWPRSAGSSGDEHYFQNVIGISDQSGGGVMAFSRENTPPRRNFLSTSKGSHPSKGSMPSKGSIDLSSYSAHSIATMISEPEPFVLMSHRSRDNFHDEYELEDYDVLQMHTSDQEEFPLNPTSLQNGSAKVLQRLPPESSVYSDDISGKKRTPRSKQMSFPEASTPKRSPGNVDSTNALLASIFPINADAKRSKKSSADQKRTPEATRAQKTFPEFWNRKRNPSISKMKEMHRCQENYGVLQSWYQNNELQIQMEDDTEFQFRLASLEKCIFKFGKLLQKLEDIVHSKGDWEQVVNSLDRLYGEADDHHRTLERRIRMVHSDSIKLEKFQKRLLDMAVSPKSRDPMFHSDPILPSVDEIMSISRMFSMNEPTCRICEEDRADPPIVLCKCTGENKYMHIDCFKESYSRQYDWWTMRCPICKQPYEGIPAIKVAEEKYRACVHDKGEDQTELDATQIASFLSNLGRAWGALGNYEKKILLDREAMKVCEAAKGKNHTNVAVHLSNMAVGYRKLRMYEKQRNCLQRALRIKERVYGYDHPQLLSTLSTLAEANNQLGTYQKQCSLLTRALKIEQRLYGKNHPNISVTLSNLGLAYEKLHIYEKARDYAYQALVIQERKFGSEHKGLATVLSILARAHGKLENFPEARDYSERVLAIQEKVYGPDHAVLAPTLINLGLSYGHLQDFVTQKQLTERALIIKENTYGGNSIDLVSALLSLGRAHGHLQEYHDMRLRVERALEIQQRIYGMEHNVLLQTLKLLAEAYAHLGDLEKSRTLHERAFVIEDRFHEELQTLTCYYGTPGSCVLL